MVNAFQPSVAMNVAEMVTVRKNSAVLTVPIVLRGLLPWTSRLEVTIAPQPPPPAASRKPPTRPERRDDPRPPLGMAVHDAAIEKIEAERGQIGRARTAWPVRRRLCGQDISAEHAADHAGDDDPDEQPPVDVAVRDVADRRHRGGEGLGAYGRRPTRPPGGTPMLISRCSKSGRTPCPARHRPAARQSRSG